MKWFLLIYGLFFSSFVIAQAGVKEGYNVFYYENGNKSSEGNIVKGKPDGYWRSYYEDGTIKNEGNRKNYQLDSGWKFFDNKGRLGRVIRYREGRKNGFITIFDSLGRVVSNENFVNDTKVGNSFLYYVNGKVKQVIPYKNGKADGISYCYSQDSVITSIIKYKMGYVEKQEKVNQIDLNGKKEGIWKEFYPDMKVKSETRFIEGKQDGYLKEYDKTGNLKEIKKFAEGKEVTDAPELAKPDIFKAYFDDGLVRYEGLFLNKMPIGTHYLFRESRRCDSLPVFNDSLDRIVKEYHCFNISITDSAYVYQDGYLIERGSVDSLRRRQKIWEEYNLSGEFRSRGPYVDDKRIGSWEFFYPNGKIEQKGKYDKKGRAQGEWNLYFDSGKLLRKENYVNDKREGELEEYTEDGKLITKGEYLGDQKEGDWLYEIANYKEMGVYHNGLPDSIWKAYYVKEKRLRFEGGFLNGDPDGKHTYYYENGKVQSTGKYVGGQKDGDWYYFDEGEFLTLKIYYENGVEMKWDGKKIDPTYEEALKVFEDANQRKPTGAIKVGDNNVQKPKDGEKQK